MRRESFTRWTIKYGNTFHCYRNRNAMDLKKKYEPINIRAIWMATPFANLFQWIMLKRVPSRWIMTEWHRMGESESERRRENTDKHAHLSSYNKLHGSCEWKMEFKLILDGCSQIEDLFNQIINLYKCTVARLYTHTYNGRERRTVKHPHTWESLLKFGCLINTRLVAWHPVHEQVYCITRWVQPIIIFILMIIFFVCHVVSSKSLDGKRHSQFLACELN